MRAGSMIWIQEVVDEAGEEESVEGQEMVEEVHEHDQDEEEEVDQVRREGEGRGGSYSEGQHVSASIPCHEASAFVEDKMTR